MIWVKSKIKDIERTLDTSPTRHEQQQHKFLRYLHKTMGQTVTS